MARVVDHADLSRDVVQEAADWYRSNTVPQAFRGLPPVLLRTVRRLSGGDWQRCVVDDDGSVTVCNRRQW